MSRWSLDEVRIGLAPERVVLRRVRRGGRPLAEQALEVAAPGEPPWSGALGALAQALAAREWQRARARVVLSDRLVRFGTVPWSERLAERAEVAEVAAAQFRAVHGERAAHWSVRVSEGRYGAAWASAAVDRALIEGLAALCASARLTLVRAEPFFAAACNRFRGAMRERSLWFAALEGDRLTAGFRDAAGWRQLASVRVAGDPLAELADLLDRHDLLQPPAPAPAPLYLFAPGARCDEAPVGAEAHPLRALGGEPRFAGAALAEVL